MCQPIGPKLLKSTPHSHPASRRARTPQMQQDIPGCSRTKTHSRPTTSTAVFSPPCPLPCHAPCSINLSLSHPVPEAPSGPLRPHRLFPASPALPAPCPDPTAPSRVRHVCTDPHAGVPPPARPSLPSDSETRLRDARLTPPPTPRAPGPAVAASCLST